MKLSPGKKHDRERPSLTKAMMSIDNGRDEPVICNEPLTKTRDLIEGTRANETAR